MPTPNFNFPTINQSDTANVPRDHNALANAVDTAFQQTEYQTATVVGAQIRVTKPSASSRIFFRLANTINGGTPITISTDGGTTSVNLMDTAGANVTRLEKGFVEIVKVGNFFILRNKSGITQSDLDALITATNEVEANNDVVREEYIETINSIISPPPLNENSSWNDILLQIPNIRSGSKKFATGNINVPSNTFIFEYYSGGETIYVPKAEFSGLDFRASHIIISPQNPAINNYTTEYYKVLGSFSEYTRISIGATSSNNALNRGLKAQTLSSYVNETGFSLPVNAAGNYIYYAYE